MFKKLLPSVVILFLLLGALGGTKGWQIASMIAFGQSFAPPPETVTTAEVKEDVWESVLRSVGTVLATEGIMVRSEVSGVVNSIAFESGASVPKGALLVRMDTGIEEAQLAAAAASQKLAGSDLERAQKLHDRKINAPAELDAAMARSQEANANLASIQASIRKKYIRASFAGRLGIRQVNLGQFLNVGDPIVSLQAVKSVYVDFSVPQRQLSSLLVGQRVDVTADSFPDQTWKGTLAVINPDLDVATRNVRVRAAFDNADERLRPGMFVEVAVVMSEQKPVRFIPGTAVIYAPYGNSVYVLEEQKTDTGTKTVALQRFVRLGESRGDMVAIDSGLELGQTVVTTGAFKLRNGVAVTVDRDHPTGATLTPKPEDS
jgi:membrane fusion protein, multidrug efflux system